MRRFIVFLLILSLLLSVSCHRTMGADEVLRNFSAAFGGAVGTVYSSEERVGARGHLTREILITLYGQSEPPLYDSVALMLYADMDGIVEYGVFMIRGGAGKRDDIVTTEAMCAYRISQISHIFKGTEGEIRRYGNTVVYFVTEDNRKAERLFSSLL